MQHFNSFHYKPAANLFAHPILFPQYMIGLNLYPPHLQGWTWKHMDMFKHEFGFRTLMTKRRPLYLKTQSVPRCKHFSSGL